MAALDLRATGRFGFAAAGFAAAVVFVRLVAVAGVLGAAGFAAEDFADAVVAARLEVAAGVVASAGAGCAG